MTYSTIQNKPQVSALFITFVLIILTLNGCSSESIIGTIEFRSNDCMIFEPIPVVLLTDDSLSNIDTLVWSASYVDVETLSSDESVDTSDYSLFLYGEHLLSLYSETELTAMFGVDFDLKTIAIFIPAYPGEYQVICQGQLKDDQLITIATTEIRIGTKPKGSNIQAFIPSTPSFLQKNG